jgi:hypothetical protein
MEGNNPAGKGGREEGREGGREGGRREGGRERGTFEGRDQVINDLDNGQIDHLGESVRGVFRRESRCVPGGEEGRVAN